MISIHMFQELNHTMFVGWPEPTGPAVTCINFVKNEFEQLAIRQGATSLPFLIQIRPICLFVWL